MISIWRYVFAPIAFLIWLKAKLRNRLFEIGIWKSVEFEFPIMNVGSLAGDPTLGISIYIQHLLKGIVHIDKYELMNHGLNKKVDYDYYSLLSQDGMITTRHRVLGIAEWYQSHAQSTSVILNNQFGLSEIRPMLNVLITNFDNPFYGDVLFPMGELKDIKQIARIADLIIVYQSPGTLNKENFEMKVRNYLKKKVPLFFISNSKESLKSFNSADQIEFIADRDNFERLIFNVIPNANPDSE